MARLRSCFEGHRAQVVTTPIANPKHMIVCPTCLVTTQQYFHLSEAVAEWNDGDSQIWRAYSNGFVTRFVRWWRGRFI